MCGRRAIMPGRLALHNGSADAWQRERLPGRTRQPFGKSV